MIIFSNGLMVEFLKEIGSMENNMEMENFLIPKLKFGEKEDGNSEKKLCFMNNQFFQTWFMGFNFFLNIFFILFLCIL